MNVLINAHQIYQIEVKHHEYLKAHETIIYIAAIVHDMCDKKYMNEEDGIRELMALFDCEKQSNDTIYIQEDELQIIKKIILTMSYSTVKKHGFPDLGKYQHAYHIVREADLLAAYDFDRAMIYHLHKKQDSIEDVCQNSIDLFDVRIFQHEKDGLLLMRFSKLQHPILALHAKQRIQYWKTILFTKCRSINKAN
jgi:hypothetical protein